VVLLSGEPGIGKSHGVSPTMACSLDWDWSLLLVL
jgi:hypothetical protein